MNGFRLVSAILSCVFVGFTAQAIPYTDLDIIGVKLSDSNPTYSGTFNILQTGYNPLSQHLVSASAWFGFGDDYSPIQDVQDLSGYKEVVKVDVGLMQGYFGPVEVDFSTILGGGLSGSLFDGSVQ